MKKIIIYLYNSISVHLYLCISLSPCIYLSVYLYLRLSISLYIYISVYLFLCISLYIPISVYLSLCLSLSPFIYLSAYLYLRLSASLYIFYELQKDEGWTIDRGKTIEKEREGEGERVHESRGTCTFISDQLIKDGFQCDEWVSRGWLAFEFLFHPFQSACHVRPMLQHPCSCLILAMAI